MSDEKFQVVAEPARKLLRITMSGHWDETTVTEYKAELIRVGEGMKCSRAEMLVLVDARDLSAQSQSVVERYKNSFSSADWGVRRLATIVSSALFKRQVQRIAIPNQQIFTTELEAIAWLLSRHDPENSDD